MSEISVVIPTLNEERRIGRLLDQLQSCPKVLEVIVSDGGSTDATRQISKSFPKVRWVNARCGRASQMNTGAQLTRSNILLFLHADSYLNIEGMRQIKPTLSQHADAGSFYLMFDQNGFWLNLYSSMSKRDVSFFTYGDQGLFIKKEVFDEIGGFREIPIMEDLDIVRRIRRSGKFKKINAPTVPYSLDTILSIS